MLKTCISVGVFTVHIAYELQFVNYATQFAVSAANEITAPNRHPLYMYSVCR